MNDTFQIRLTSLKDIQAFENIICDSDLQVELHSGRYCVNGRSFMGICTLDLSNPITVRILSPTPNAEPVLQKLLPFRTDLEQFQHDPAFD